MSKEATGTRLPRKGEPVVKATVDILPPISAGESVPALAGSTEVSTLPTARWKGEIDLGGEAVECYVLDDERRMISLRGVVKALAHADNGRIENYIGAGALRNFMDVDSIMSNLIEFSIPGFSLRNGKGMTTGQFMTIIRAYIAALQHKAPLTSRQREIAVNCSVLAAAFMHLGLDAVVDEATGFQRVRSEDALQVKLKAFIADELRAWTKTFPDDLWREFGRLANWKDPLRNRPLWWGKLVTWLIYDTLDPDVARYLKDNKPPPHNRWHQQLTLEVGIPRLVSRCFEVIGIAKGCSDIQELCEKVDKYYGRGAFQFSLTDLMHAPRNKRAPRIRSARKPDLALPSGTVPEIGGIVEEAPTQPPEQLDMMSSIGEALLSFDFEAEAAANRDPPSWTAHERFAEGRSTRLD